MKKVSFAKPLTVSFTKEVLQKIKTNTNRKRIVLEKATTANNTIGGEKSNE